MYFNGSAHGLGLELEAVIDGVSNLTNELLKDLDDVPCDNVSNPESTVSDQECSDFKIDKNESDFFKVVARVELLGFLFQVRIRVDFCFDMDEVILIVLHLGALFTGVFIQFYR